MIPPRGIGNDTCSPLYTHLPGQGAGSVLRLEAEEEVPEVFEAGGTDSPAGLTKQAAFYNHHVFVILGSRS